MPDIEEKDNLSFLDEPLRDEQGRFAPREPAPAEAPTPPPPTTAVPPPAGQPEPAPQAHEPNAEPWKEAKWWDEKEKRQRLERELEDHKRKLAELTQKPQERIDPIIDPEGWEQAQQATLKQREWDLTTKMTRMFAVRQYGPEQVAAAEQWVAQELQTNPGFFMSIEQQDDPYDFVVRSHRRALNAQRLGDDPFETVAEKWARENGYVKLDPSGQPAMPHAGAPSPQLPARAPLPRPSIANAPAAAPTAKANVMQDEAEAFSEVFSRKR